MPLTDLSSSHIRVFNLPFCNLFQQSQGSGLYTWPACIWRLIFSLSSVPSWANDAFSQDWKSLRKCCTSKGRCGPVPKELCLRQTTPHSVYPSSPSFGWQQGSKKKTQQMLGRRGPGITISQKRASRRCIACGVILWIVEKLFIQTRDGSLQYKLGDSDPDSASLHRSAVVHCIVWKGP